MAKEGKYYRVPRGITLKCSKCNRTFYIEVTNIYKDDILEVINCPECGSNKSLEILKIKRI